MSKLIEFMEANQAELTFIEVTSPDAPRSWIVGKISEGFVRCSDRFFDAVETQLPKLLKEAGYYYSGIGNVDPMNRDNYWIELIKIPEPIAEAKRQEQIAKHQAFLDKLMKAIA